MQIVGKWIYRIPSSDKRCNRLKSEMISNLINIIYLVMRLKRN